MDDSGDNLARRLIVRLPLLEGRPLAALAVGVAIAIAAFGLRLALNPHLPPGMPYITFFPATVLACMAFGLWAGLASWALGFVLARWFFVAPFFSLSLGGPPGWAMAVYSVVTFFIVMTIHTLQRAFGQLELERQRNAELAASRALLLQELQHRVGNNLQMIGSLLALQGRRVAEGPAREAVEQAARRVHLVGRIQRTLYDAQGSARSLSAMLRPLLQDIVDVGNSAVVTIRLDARRDVLLRAEQAIPVALIVGEAVSNAVEHGFSFDQPGVLLVRVTGEIVDGREMLRITVEDDGRGLPPDFDLATSNSLGLKISRALAEGLKGTFTMGSASGATGGAMAILSFPMPPDAANPLPPA